LVCFQRLRGGGTNDNTPAFHRLRRKTSTVAALYFLGRRRRGGQSGYLVSEPGATEWLQAGALKSLIGYPVEVVSRE